MKRRYRKRKINPLISLCILAMIAVLTYFKDDINRYISNNFVYETEQQPEIVLPSYNLNDIPEYDGEAYVVINNNEPFFDDDELTLDPLEEYSPLDSLGRCGVAKALVGIETMPTEERGSIGMVKPSGWPLKQAKYDFIDGKYLYNRCHLIGFQLAGENANKQNLITCTRYMNTVGMLQFENKVAKYVRDTNNHVLYRVTPMYYFDNLLASGVLMEAYSIEDNGEGIKFNVYVYNVQEGVEINYLNGESKLKDSQKN